MYYHLATKKTFLMKYFSPVRSAKVFLILCDEQYFIVKLRLQDVIYRLRLHSDSLIHILSLSNSLSNVASIQRNRGDKSGNSFLNIPVHSAVFEKLHNCYFPSVQSHDLKWMVTSVNKCQSILPMGYILLCSTATCHADNLPKFTGALKFHEFERGTTVLLNLLYQRFVPDQKLTEVLVSYFFRSDN